MFKFVLIKLFKLFLLFGFIFSYISPYDYRTITIGYVSEFYKTYYESYSFITSFQYDLDFDFLTIKVENIYSEYLYLGQMAFLSFYDINCVNDRRQISYNLYGDSIMIIKKSELKNLNKFYICVKCLESGCGYRLRFDQNYIQRIPMTDIAYSYIASQNYTKMNFGIRSELNIIDLIEKYSYSGHYELFWIKRMFSNDFIKYYYHNDTIKEDYNAVYLLNNMSRKNRLIDFNVSSQEGDIIKVGSSLIYPNKNEFYEYKSLNVNDVEVVGHLNKNNLTKICYTFSYNINYSNKDLFNLYIYVVEKFAKIFFYSFTKIEKEIINGNFLLILSKSELENGELCVTFLESEKYNIPDSITFTVQVISHKLKLETYYFLSPQNPQDIYPRLIQKGENIILSAIKPPNKSNIMSFTLNSIYGNPRLKTFEISTFPSFSYDSIKTFNDSIETNILKNYNNLFRAKSYYDSNQTLFVLYCDNPDDFCIFDTTFFSQNEFISLKEGTIFSQLLSEKDSNFFNIDVEIYKNIGKIFLELIIYKGNAKLNIIQENLKIVNYFLLNRIIYIIDVKDSNLKTLQFEVKSDTKAFYSVRYSVEENKMNLMDTIGINIIDYISNEYKYKNFEVQNSKYNQIFPIIFNFYSPNCKVNIYKNGDTKLNTYLYDNFYQDSINISNQINYNYNISIKEFDPYNYPDKKCILYSNNFKIMTENSKKIATLLINENIPLVHKFDKNFTIRYIYPNYDYTRDTLINFKLINNRKYFINITDNSNNMILQKIITKTETINIEKNKYKPITDKNNLIIDITLEDSLEDIPLLQTTLRQIKNRFHYLEKGMFKNENIPKEGNLYLYTEIGKEDNGFIMIDFLNEKIEIKAKIIEINNIYLNSEVNWESINSENLFSKYEYYTKKLFFTNKETSKCENGCYLLINLQAPQIKDLKGEIKYFNISILVSLTKRKFSKSIKIKSDFDKNIVGTLFNYNYEDEKMFELYEIYIPYNAKSIDIECKLKNTTLLVYVKDKEEIDLLNSDYKVEYGQIISINKDEINNSFENTRITICVYAEKFYFKDIAYSFSIHLNKKEDLKIYKINQEQKTLCKPSTQGRVINSCLFMIESGNLLENNYLIIFANSFSENTVVDIYANFLTNNTIYDFFDIDILEKNIPNVGATYTTGREKINYILVPPTTNQNYLYLRIYSYNQETVELIPNYFNYNENTIFNPYLKQVFILNNNNKIKNEINLNVISTNSIMIKVVALEGEGEIYFSEKTFSLNENNNQILFTFPSDLNENIYFKNEKKGNNNFIFYIEYELRNSQINLDEIVFYEHSNINYINTKFPILLYSKINEKQYYDINIFFNIDMITSENSNKFIYNKDFDFSNLFIEKKDQYKILDESERKKLYNIKGSYDAALGIGQIYIPKDYANKFISNLNNNITYLISLEKFEDNINNNDILYRQISMKTSFVKENSGIPIEENKYYYGKIIDNNTYNIYKLKLENDYEFIKIQFSSNSKIINFTITKDDDNFESSILDAYEIKEQYGKIIAKLKIPEEADYLYLNVFMNNSLNISDNLIDKLNNYAFKYNNIYSDDIINKYQVLDEVTKLTCSIFESNGEVSKIQISYNTIKNQKDFEVIYSLKIVNKEDLIEGELYDTIAMTESNSKVLKIRKTNVDDKNGVINIPLDIYDNNFTYIELIAQIIDGENIEFIAYESIKSVNEIIFKYENKEKEKSKFKSILIIIIVLVLVIAIVVFCIIRYKKRKALSEDEEIKKQVEMSNPIEYDDVLLDRPSDVDVIN